MTVLLSNKKEGCLAICSMAGSSEGIMLSKLRQRKIDTTLSYLYVKSKKKKKKNSQIQGTDWWLPKERNGKQAKMSKGGQEVQTSCYKISHGDIMKSMLITIYNTVLYV